MYIYNSVYVYLLSQFILKQSLECYITVNFVMQSQHDTKVQHSVLSYQYQRLYLCQIDK